MVKYEQVHWGKMDEENDLVVDLFPCATNTGLLEETLDDLLPCKSYVLDTITLHS